MRGKETGYKKYQEIIADYNREKDRATVGATLAQLVALASSLDTEQRLAAEEGLSDDELALFDLLFKQSISKADRERLKQASKSLLQSLQALLEPMPKWTQNSATQAEVRVFILDNLWQSLPRPPFADEPKPSRVVCMTTSGSAAPAGTRCWLREAGRYDANVRSCHRMEIGTTGRPGTTPHDGSNETFIGGGRP